MIGSLQALWANRSLSAKAIFATAGIAADFGALMVHSLSQLRQENARARWAYEHGLVPVRDLGQAEAVVSQLRFWVLFGATAGTPYDLEQAKTRLGENTRRLQALLEGFQRLGPTPKERELLKRVQEFLARYREAAADILREDPGDQGGVIRRGMAAELATQMLLLQEAMDNLGKERAAMARAAHRQGAALFQRTIGWQIAVAALVGLAARFETGNGHGAGAPARAAQGTAALRSPEAAAPGAAWGRSDPSA